MWTTMRYLARSYDRGNALCLAGVLVLAMVAGCAGDDGKEETSQGEVGEKTEAPAAAKPAVDEATAGTIAGSVVFEGTPPPMKLIDVSSELTCHSKAEENPMYTESVVVNDDGTLRNVFVYVKEGLPDVEFPVPSDPVVLDQQGCRYIPHVFGIQANQPLVIKNSDEGVLHNIHTFSKKGNSFNFGMPKVMETTKTLKKAEIMVPIKCDVHGWMNAYVGILDHPYFGVTGEDGSFNLAPLPPGEYVIEAWHEEYGAQTQTVTVAPKEMKEVTFTFAPGS